MRQRQTGGDPRQRPAGKQLHRFTGQGRHLRHRVAGQQTAAAGHHVNVGREGSPPGPGAAASAVSHHAPGIWRATKLALVVKSSTTVPGSSSCCASCAGLISSACGPGGTSAAGTPRSLNWLVDSALSRASPSPSAPATSRLLLPGCHRHPAAQCAPPSYAGEVVGLLHQLAAWRAQAAGIVTRRVLFGAADIKQEGGAVALLLPALQRGLIDDRHPGPFGKMRHLSGPGAEARAEGSYCRCCWCASVWPASVQPIVPLRRAWTGFGTPALISDWCR